MAAAITLDALAESKGMSMEDFINKYMNGQIFITDRQNNNPNSRGAFQELTAEMIASGSKGVIFACQNSDFSTFQHELFHFASRVN